MGKLKDQEWFRFTLKGNYIDKDSVGFHLNHASFQALTLESGVFIPKVIQCIISNHENLARNQTSMFQNFFIAHGEYILSFESGQLL